MIWIDIASSPQFSVQRHQSLGSVLNFGRLHQLLRLNPVCVDFSQGPPSIIALFSAHRLK
jgi:hypothetical protein